MSYIVVCPWGDTEALISGRSAEHPTREDALATARRPRAPIPPTQPTPASAGRD